MNVLLMGAHSIEEFDQLRLMHDLGYTVASIGGYIDPAHPHDPKRPPLADIPRVDVVWDAVQDTYATEQRPDRLWNAKDHLPQAVIDWADVVIVHECEWRWLRTEAHGECPQCHLGPNWDRLRDKRVIWRTVGQSSHENEARMAPLRAEGLQVVRYSPKERDLPNYIGEDALIRFWKDPAEWHGWDGHDAVVTNVTQNIVERAFFCNLQFWLDATQGLAVVPAGRQSDQLPGGLGELDFEDMKTLLQASRVYLYTGTQPASYTLGLIDAAMTGIPVVSIGPGHMRALPYGPKLFEGHEIALHWSDDPTMVRMWLKQLLVDPNQARDESAIQRDRAISMFGRDTIGAQWQDFLG
jgi:hypothetical protein